MKIYIIKFLRFMRRPLPRFAFGFLLAVVPMLIGVELLHIDEYGPQYYYGIFCGVGLKIMFDSVIDY